MDTRYNSIGLLSGRSSLTNYLTSMGVSSVSNLVIPTMSIPLSSSVSYSASPMFGLGEGGLLCGVSLCFGFNFGDDWNMTVSGGVSNQYAAANISATCKGWGPVMAIRSTLTSQLLRIQPWDVKV